MAKKAAPAPTRGKPAGGRSAPQQRSAAGRPAQRGVVVEAPQNDIYTALLLVSLLSILFGCGLLTWLWSYYEFAVGAK